MVFKKGYNQRQHRKNIFSGWSCWLVTKSWYFGVFPPGIRGPLAIKWYFYYSFRCFGDPCLHWPLVDLGGGEAAQEIWFVTYINGASSYCRRQVPTPDIGRKPCSCWQSRLNWVVLWGDLFFVGENTGGSGLVVLKAYHFLELFFWGNVMVYLSTC